MTNEEEKEQRKFPSLAESLLRFSKINDAAREADRVRKTKHLVELLEHILKEQKKPDEAV